MAIKNAWRGEAPSILNMDFSRHGHGMSFHLQFAYFMIYL
jgi:hypothetical protein